MPRNRINDDSDYEDELLPETPVPQKSGDFNEPQNVDKLLALLFDPGEWFRMPYAIIRAMNGGNAVMLSYLINQSCRINSHDRRKGDKKEWRGWFYCTAKQMEGALGIPERSQRYVLTELRRHGFIETEQRGTPAKRYFKINWKRVVKVLEFSE